MAHLFPQLFRAPVGRSNQYSLGRTIVPPMGTPFVAPPRTPCVDFDYDQANEARLRALHNRRNGLAPRASRPIEQPKLITTPSRDSFKALRDEYHHYHVPFRKIFGSDTQTRQFHNATGKMGVKQAIASYEQQRPFTQLFRRREKTVVELDPDLLKLAEQMMYLEEGLNSTCRNIIFIRNELMVLDCSCRYARFRI